MGFMHKSCYWKTLLSMLAAGLLSGCLTMTIFKNIAAFFQPGKSAATGEDIKTRIEIVPVGIPEKGEQIVIGDSKSDAEYTVTIGDVYTSASGKFCGRYTVTDGEQTRESGLVCLEQQDGWVKVPLQIPLNN